jgi:2-methylcitrate dehydratase PrpD
MAAGLVDGMVTPLQFKEERVLDKALIPIMDKVKVVPNEEFEALFPKFQPSRVTITTNDGKSHATRVSKPFAERKFEPEGRLHLYEGAHDAAGMTGTCFWGD